jgi:hypothetical protein
MKKNRRKEKKGKEKEKKKKKKRKGKKKGREKKKEGRKIEKINYLFFRNCDLQFILTILLLNNKNKI